MTEARTPRRSRTPTPTIGPPGTAPSSCQPGTATIIVTYPREKVHSVTRKVTPAMRERGYVECECGCGQVTRTLGSRFVIGHWNRLMLKDVAPPVWDGECLRWMGAHDADGYGRFRQRPIHRWLWNRFNGAVPDDLTIDHVLERGCQFRDCIRLTHMEPVTRSENTRRNRISRARRARIHCPADHEYSKANTRIKANGSRDCKECHRLQERARRARIRLESTP